MFQSRLESGVVVASRVVASKTVDSETVDSKAVTIGCVAISRLGPTRPLTLILGYLASKLAT